jgi:hypothetical protein
LTITPYSGIIELMDEYEYDEGSDIDNWEDEQVFQDREGDEDDESLNYWDDFDADWRHES